MKKYYDDPQYNAAFDRFIDVMTQLMQKYGPKLLEKQSEKQRDDQGGVDHAA